MITLDTIAEHTICKQLLTGGVVIDAGCRGFEFSRAMTDLGEYVMAFDLEHEKEMFVDGKLTFYRAAVLDKPGMVHYKQTRDPQGTHVSNSGNEIIAISLNDFYNGLGIVCVDVLKLDVEGSEYYILSDPNFKPVPIQISVEFHEHCHKKAHEVYFDTCMINLLKYYEPVQHVRDSRHGAGYNYWDSLFIRKDYMS